MDLTDWTKKLDWLEVAHLWSKSKGDTTAEKGTAEYYGQAATSLLRKLNRSIPEAQKGTSSDIEATLITMLPKSVRGVPRKERKPRTKLDEYAHERGRQNIERIR